MVKIQFDVPEWSQYYSIDSLQFLQEYYLIHLQILPHYLLKGSNITFCPYSSTVYGLYKTSFKSQYLQKSDKFINLFSPLMQIVWLYILLKLKLFASKPHLIKRKCQMCKTVQNDYDKLFYYRRQFYSPGTKIHLLQQHRGIF